MPLRPTTLIRALAATALLSLCATTAGVAAGSQPLDPANLDPAVQPSADFYAYAVGGWLARTQIPPDRTSWGSFDEAQQRVNEQLRAIMESPDLAASPAGSEPRKVGDFYATCVDLDQIEQNNLRALQPALSRIAALKNVSQIGPAVNDGDRIAPAFAQRSPLFRFGAEQDPKEATRVIGDLSQGGIVLAREDYLGSDQRAAAIRAAYATYARRTFALLGDDAATASTETDAVLRIETELATASKPAADLRDPFANYHPMRVAQLAALAPHFPWAAYFGAIGLREPAAVVIDVGQPGFFSALDRMLVSEPVAAWKSYLRWHIAASNPTAEPKAYGDAYLELQRARTGLERDPDRWRTCTDATSSGLAFPLGTLYVRRYFSPEARERARHEIVLIKTQLRADIETLDWMGPVTRAAALAKLDKLATTKVGYPDHPRSYEALTIGRSDYLANVVAANSFAFGYQVGRIGGPVDRDAWGFPPQTVNASYNPLRNEITIPAGILQPPFFSPDADDAVNFGGIGAVIGHELTHGFDDEGSNFDGNGNLRPWMTPDDQKRFRARVQCVIDQANAYPVGDLHLNGRLVVGEATADLGGTTLAYKALVAALAQGSPAAKIGGFTPAQRFYLSWAQVWRNKMRPLAERAQVLTNPHPVARYRVNATVADDDPFYAAFGIAPGSPMYIAPAQRCRIW